MTHLLEEHLAVARSYFSPLIISDEAFSRLVRASEILPPIPKLGFECRLADNDTQVDLIQLIYADDGEPELLVRHLETLLQAMEDPDPGWKNLYRFATEWKQSPDLRETIREVWLEVDVPEKGAPPPLPSIFIGLNDEERSGTVLLEIIGSALEALRGRTASPELMDNISRCFHGLPPDSSLVFVGAMLSRPEPIVRVEVKRLMPDHVRPYLIDIGWKGPMDQVEELSRWIMTCAEGLMLGLDVGNQIYPAISVTGSIFRMRDVGRWHALLGGLAEKGLCSRRKAQKLLEWPGQITPVDCPEPWPEVLILQELSRPGTDFGVFERILNHIKIRIKPDGAREAKAYLGLGHMWISAGGQHPIL